MWKIGPTSMPNIKACIYASILLVFLVGCPCKTPASKGTDVVQTRDWISIYQHPMELRLSKPKDPLNSNILVVYGTGDGGWRGLDQQVFEWISTWNFPVVGFSSKSYLENLGYIRDTTTPRRLVRDYETIIKLAEQKLDMQQSPRIILVGLSRGAGLAVVAAGQGELKPSLAGVVAIALTKEEEHVVRYRRRDRSQPYQLKHELLMVQTYEYLPRIAPVPVMVIQSTHDDYLPADAARALFGSDTEMKKFLPINAKNHSFSGGCLDLYRGTQAALDWIHGYQQSAGGLRR
jgi:pimeloyl-ACP methyl ester carboxylesterase